MAVTKRVYPDVPMVADEKAQSSLRKLWDKIFDHEQVLNTSMETLKAAQDTITAQASTITDLKAKVNRIAGNSTLPNRPGIGGGISPPPSGNSDDGQGAAGCTGAGSTGHLTAPFALDAVSAGMVVCGTGNEFSYLLAPTADQPTRDANSAELLSRMIWHLQQAGFTAGKQKNPSGVISGDKVTVEIAGEMRAYDVMSLTTFDTPLTTHMVQVWPANYQADGGTPD